MEEREYPRASKVIEHLQKLIAEHGDLPVCVRDADTECIMALGVVFARVDWDQEHTLPWPHFEVTSAYSRDPWGKVQP